MLMVGTELRPSGIHGIGVFLTQSVRAGQLIWRFDSRIDRVFSDAELAELPDLMQDFLRTYSTLDAERLDIVTEGYDQEDGWGYRHLLLRSRR